MTSVEMRRSEFRHAIGLASRIIGRRNTIPILSMARCRANGSFEATGTDLDTEIVARVPRDGEGDGEFMLSDPRFMLAATAQAGGKTLKIEVDDGAVLYSTGALSVKQKATLPVGDFPVTASISSVALSAIMGDAFVAGLRRVSAAISTEETRYYLNGVYLHHVEGWNYRLVATDGHRLMVQDLPIPDSEGVTGGVIIPRRVVRLLIETASRSRDGIAIRFGSTSGSNRVEGTVPDMANAPRAEFSFSDGVADVAISAKLIDGTFPDYTRVIPTADGKRMLFKANDLRRAVAAASCGSGKVRAVRIELTKAGANISASYLDAGLEASSTIDCQHRESGFVVGFNGQYLLDLIDVLGGEEVSLMMGDSASPCLAKNPADPAFTAVLMPMRV